MCLIVDANVASLVFRSPVADDYAPIFDWLERDGVLVYGGRLAEELLKIRSVADYLLQLNRAGRAHREPDEAVEVETAVVCSTGLCRSDDEHVLALARLTRTRTLCTADKDLMDDFRDTDIVPRPAGRIYQNVTHRRLLEHSAGCVGSRRARASGTRRRRR